LGRSLCRVGWQSNCRTGKWNVRVVETHFCSVIVKGKGKRDQLDGFVEVGGEKRCGHVIGEGGKGRGDFLSDVLGKD